MYCPSCGSQNPDTASFCFKCGAKLPTATQQASASPPVMGSSPVPAQPQATHKDPVLAAILNLFFGIGYLYLGYTTVLGLPTIAFIILAVIAYALIGYFTLGIVSLLLAILLAYDGYQKGKGLKGFIDAKMA